MTSRLSTTFQYLLHESDMVWSHPVKKALLLIISRNVSKSPGTFCGENLMFRASRLIRTDGFSADGQTRQCRKIWAWLPEGNHRKSYQLEFAQERKAAENQLIEVPLNMSCKDHVVWFDDNCFSAFFKKSSPPLLCFWKTALITAGRERQDNIDLL